MADANRISLGQIVQILRGRESGTFAIVVKKQSNYVWLANGRNRTVERPKKKNIKHIQPTNKIVTVVADALDKFESVDNAVLQYALNQYQPSSKTLKESE